MGLVKLTRLQAKSKTIKNRIAFVILAIIVVAGLLSIFPSLLADSVIPKIIVVAICSPLFLLWIPTTPIICEKCDSDRGYQKVDKIIATRFKHSRKDGQPDVRFKNNPQINTIDTTKTCVNCQHQNISTKDVEDS